jgi:hydrogenase expression/formation protein HypD
MLIRQLNAGRADIENQYTRAVTAGGNRRAQAIMQQVFERRPAFEWRGLGEIPESALAIRDEYGRFDAERRFPMHYEYAHGTKSCDCPAILRGVKKPTDCKLFATSCTPDNPLGSCMVSDEGACAAYYTYGRFRQEALERKNRGREQRRAERDGKARAGG